MVTNPIPKEYQPQVDLLLSAMNIHAPLFASIYYQMMVENGGLMFEADMPTCATDGKRMIVGPTFFTWSRDEQLFATMHEIGHVMLDHIERGRAYADRGFGPDLLPYQPSRMNKAMDYVINAMLVDAGFKKMPPGGLLNPRWGADRLSDVVYTELPEEPEDERDGEGTQPTDHGGFDQHLPPNGPPKSEQDRQLDDAKRKGAIANAIATAKAMGKLPGGLERVLQGIIKPEKPWREILRDHLIQHTGREEQSWNRPRRRSLALAPHIPMPGRTGFSMGCLVLAIDTSGSISDETMAEFIGAMSEIMEQLAPREFHVIWWDTAAQHEDFSDQSLEDVEAAKPFGGGGTYYDCVPPTINELGLDPDAVVCLTDGYVAWPPASEILWPHITVTTTSMVAPFGATISM